MTARRYGSFGLLGATLTMACGGTIAVKPPALVAVAARPSESPDLAFLAWAHEQPPYSVAEKAYMWDRFDVATQIRRDHAPLLAPSLFATATLARSDGSLGLGAVRFEEESSKILIHARLTGLAPGEHGITINDGASCASLAMHPAEHWNPTGSKHGPIGSGTRHVGDFGNLTVAADGTASFAVLTDSFRLSGDASVVGKTFVIHARRDDGKTQPSGNSGPSVACGVVVRSGLQVATGN